MNGFTKSFGTIRNYVRMNYANGKWSKAELIDGTNMEIPITSSGLHYGQSCFEGMKAYYIPSNMLIKGLKVEDNDSGIYLYQPYQHWERFCQSQTLLVMPNLEYDVFMEALLKIINANREFIETLGHRRNQTEKTGKMDKTQNCGEGSFYLRPLLFGSGSTSAVKPASEYTFLVYGFPTGNDFYPELKLVTTPYHRSASNGTGNIKASGNYAGVMLAHQIALLQGYDECLYLDSVHNKYIEEIGAANFIAFKGNTLYTPKSSSILPSITRKTLMKLYTNNTNIRDQKISEDPISVERLGEFDSVAACGTAAGIVSVKSITHNGITFTYKESNNLKELKRIFRVEYLNIWNSLRDGYQDLIKVPE